ncbi:MAG: response regulator [Candidatus Aminicenantes bacterium]|nr:response regulator [Candidatus Aminicenantes bacterium]NIM80011.1 response regulator [Candidatus Aminicenantes bacterium]NIN19365.1 response regulator [Candidatus Aminicenantes bacterium]NIN43264.1 response regulator [Candidatus Aminicenantes bacterium]NIN86006.1 response regulator [Candidatus Aminicenantes bacterium]
MSDKFNILVVEDDVATGKVISFELKAKGYNSRCFENAEEALVFFRKNSVDLILVDYTLPGMNGEEFFLKVKELNPLMPVIFITALQSVDKAVQLLKMGAYTYLTKPLKMEELHHNIKNALEKVTLVKENLHLQEKLKETFSFKNYVFNSEGMQKILHMVMRVATSNSNVLITGESGTGKDVIAHIIHYCSGRKDHQLVKVNLASLPATLIEAELFGAVKGAYTGAVANRPGKFEEADKGTLFLDEIGELSLDIQVKLLRVIQDREVTRLGSNKPIKVDIRLITATNRNIQESVKEKKFREDLFYRLNVINIDLPPLRERKEDIPLLIDLFIKKFNQREGKQIKTLSKDALNALMKYPFPGNIRELENIIERALVLARGEMLGTDDLPVFVLSRESPGSVSFNVNIDSSLAIRSLPNRLTAIEKDILEKTLKRHNYHQTNAARELGISEARLRYKVRTLGVHRTKKNGENR